MDAIVVDLPTAFYITAAEVTDARIVGQFENQGGTPEQFGLVLDKGSALTVVRDGRRGRPARGRHPRRRSRQQWLSDAVDAPVLK